MMKLIALLVAAVFMAAIWAFPATSQQAVPEQSAFLTACQSANATAIIAGLNVERCRRVSELVEGNTALVTVKVWVSGQGVFFVTVSLMQSAWGQQAIFIRPV